MPATPPHSPALLFASAPLLLSWRGVLALGVDEKSLRWLLNARMRCAGEERVALRMVCPYGPAQARDRLYVKADLAPHLGLEMDWGPFERWPLHLKRWHLLDAGLNRHALEALEETGQLRPLPAGCVRLGFGARGKGECDRRWLKWELGKLVGYE